MSFVFRGFDQNASMRQFRFENVAADHIRTPVVVSADLSLARLYKIQVQQLPLVCRELLEQCDAETLALGAVVLTEAHMATLRNAAVRATEDKVKRPGRPGVPGNLGKAWRTPGPSIFMSR